MNKNESVKCQLLWPKAKVSLKLLHNFEYINIENQRPKGIIKNIMKKEK